MGSLRAQRSVMSRFSRGPRGQGDIELKLYPVDELPPAPRAPHPIHPFPFRAMQWLAILLFDLLMSSRFSSRRHLQVPTTYFPSHYLWCILTFTVKTLMCSVRVEIKIFVNLTPMLLICLYTKLDYESKVILHIKLYGARSYHLYKIKHLINEIY